MNHDDDSFAIVGYDGSEAPITVTPQRNIERQLTMAVLYMQPLVSMNYPLYIRLILIYGS